MGRKTKRRRKKNKKRTRKRKKRRTKKKKSMKATIGILTVPLSGRNSKASRSAVPGVEWIFGPVPDSDFSNETRNDFSDVPLY